MSLARDCGVKISLTSDRENTILSFPSLASNDLSNFKEEEGEVFSTVVDNSNGPRLVSKKYRPFSREEGIYIRGINLGYIFRENSKGLKREICRYR